MPVIQHTAYYINQLFRRSFTNGEGHFGGHFWKVIFNGKVILAVTFGRSFWRSFSEVIFRRPHIVINQFHLKLYIRIIYGEPIKTRI